MVIIEGSQDPQMALRTNRSTAPLAGYLVIPCAGELEARHAQVDECPLGQPRLLLPFEGDACV